MCPYAASARRRRADMRFGVFKLVYKTAKVAPDGDAVKYTYRLVFRDGFGNQFSVNGTKTDYEIAEVGDPLPWESVIRQSTLQGG